MLPIDDRKAVDNYRELMKPVSPTPSKETQERTEIERCCHLMLQHRWKDHKNFQAKTKEKHSGYSTGGVKPDWALWLQQDVENDCWYLIVEATSDRIIERLDIGPFVVGWIEKAGPRHFQGRLQAKPYLIEEYAQEIAGNNYYLPEPTEGEDA